MNIGTTSGFITLKTKLLNALEMIHQDGGNIFTGSLRTYGADIVCNHRHTVNDAGLFILSDGKRAALPHLEKAVRPVASHTGHDDTDLIDGDVCRD